MPRPRVIRDLDHSGFPHGTTIGYDRGCHGIECGCTEARNARDRHLHEQRVRGRNINTRPVAVVEAHDHIAFLQQDTEWGTIANIAAAAGIDDGTARKIINDRGGKSQSLTVRAILAVDHRALRRAAAFCPARIAEQRVRSMQAQGWTLAWQAGQLGYDRAPAPPFLFVRYTMVTREVFDRVQALYRRVGSQRGPSARAAATAAKLGWYPATSYDDDGHLIPGSVRNEAVEQRRAERHRLAEARIRVLQQSLDGHSTREVADLTGVHLRVVSRYRTESGVRFVTGAGNHSEVAPECAERAAQLRRAIAEYYSVYPAIDPYEMLLELGMMQSRRFLIAGEQADEQAA